jgi:Tol biopolymer transport system component
VRIHTAVIEPSSRAVREPPRAVTDPVWHRSYAADWSPDGSRLAYVTHDPFPDPVESLRIVTARGEVTRSIALTPAVHSSNGTLRWVSEERILVYGYEQGREGIHEVDLRSGRARRLVTPESMDRAALKWFEAGPGGRTLYFVASPRPGDRNNELLALEVETGRARVIGAARVIPNTLAVSPDGSELAFLARGDSAGPELRIMALGSGSMRGLPGMPAGGLSAPVAWSADGSRVIVELTDAGVPALWSFGTQGGEPVQLLAGCCRENDVRLDVQGRKIAFAAGAERGEIRLLQY